MELEGALNDLRLLAFTFVTAAAVLLWLRNRSDRPRRYLVATFLAIFSVLILGRLDELLGLPRVVSAIAPTVLLFVPWLLTAFAWSFEGRLPQWLRSAALIVVASGLATGTLSAQPGNRTTTAIAILIAYVAIFTALTGAATWRLWTAGRGLPSVVARMRLLAGGILALNLALMIVVTNSGSNALALIAGALPVVSAGLFLFGFVAPAPLRHYWRYQTTRQFSDMQSNLISATTPVEITTAVTPMLAELVGGGAAVIDGDGDVLAESHFSRGEAALLGRHLAGGGQVSAPDEVFDLDGSWLVIRPTPYSPLFGEDERELVHGLAMQLQLALDRAALYASERRARRLAEDAKRRFEVTVSGLAHDLRSPTVSLAGFAHLLEMGVSPDEQHEIIGHVRTATAYVEGLVNALLEVSRVGRIDTETEPVALDAVARRVADRWCVNHPRARIDVEGPLPIVEINPVRAEQLLDNLVGNALKHSGRDDVTVKIHATSTDEEVVILVQDDGQGIPEAERETVFDPFTRGRAALAHEGSGIGLNLVQRIAESYGGRATLGEVPRGACVRVHLPLRLVRA